MKRILATLALLALSISSAMAGDLVNVDGESHVALQGFDPVGFFTEGRAVQGDKAITVEHGGAVYQFASEANKAAFEKDPAKYAPAFGGYCAFGVSIGKLFPVEIGTWRITDGRLFFQKDADVAKLFDENPAENLQKADANWPKLVESNGM